MKYKVFIDGKEGTTGLKIFDRLAGRSDLEILLIDEDKRKDVEERLGISLCCNPGGYRPENECPAAADRAQ